MTFLLFVVFTLIPRSCRPTPLLMKATPGWLLGKPTERTSIIGLCKRSPASCWLYRPLYSIPSSSFPAYAQCFFFQSPRAVSHGEGHRCWQEGTSSWHSGIVSSIFLDESACLALPCFPWTLLTLALRSFLHCVIFSLAPVSHAPRHLRHRFRTVLQQRAQDGPLGKKMARDSDRIVGHGAKTAQVSFAAIPTLARLRDRVSLLSVPLFSS